MSCLSTYLKFISWNQDLLYFCIFYSSAGYKAEDPCFNANTAGDEYGNCGKDDNDVPIKCAEK